MNTEEIYNKYYESILFERRGLFKLINSNFKINEVLYPGSSVHLAPSFYFKHVVYLDKSTIAINFFHDTESVTKLINKNKTYRQNSYFKFIGKDFKENPDMNTASFDLLLSLYSNGVFRFFEKYLKPGGYFLYNDFNNELPSILTDNRLSLINKIIYTGKDYIFFDGVKRKKTKTSCKTVDGFEVCDDQSYYLFKKK